MNESSKTAPVSFRSVLSRLALVLVCVVVVNLAFGLVMDFARSRCVNRESGLINEGRKARADVLILGSSRAKHHFDEKLLSSLWGVSVYNGGFSGQGIPFSRVAFEQIAAVKKPKAVIIEVIAFDDDLDRVHAYDPWYFDSRVLREMPAAGPLSYTEASVPVDMKSELLMLLPTYRFAGKIGLTLRDKPRLGENAFFEPLPVRYVPDRWIAGGATVRPKPYPWLAVQLGALVDEVRATGADVVLTYSPNFGDANNTAITVPAAAVAKAKGVPFIEFTSAMIPAFKDRKYYDDPIHLNGDGAKIFSTELARLLRPMMPKVFGAGIPPETTSTLR